MTNLYRIAKISTFFLFILFVVASCKKETEDTTPKYSAEIEAELIKDWLEYMAENGKDIDTTSTGLFYIVINEGTGPTVLTGDSLTVKYIGFFMNGVGFDSSLDYGDGTYSYIHKDTNPKKRMISGWEEGVEVMSKGSKAIVLIPSEKAYGVNGYGRIPPYTPLLFEIEIVDIK